MRRALVIRFSSLGDITLTLPSVERLCAQSVEVHFLTKRSFRPLLESHGYANAVHTISDHASLAELVRLALALRKLDFDIVYDFHRNIRSLVVKMLLRCTSKTIAKSRIKEVFLFIFRSHVFKKLALRPIDRAGAALSMLDSMNEGIDFESARAGSGFRNLPVPPPEFTSWKEKVSWEKGFVCFGAESAWVEKQWPVDRFFEVARRLRDEGYGIVWLGLKRLPELASQVDSLDLTTRLRVPEVLAVMQKASAVVCNDSGLLHLAEAVGTPVVAIFGPTTRHLGFGTRLKRSRVVETDLWCRPCSKTGRFCIRPLDRRRCLTAVSVEDVTTSVFALLKHNGRTESKAQE